MKVITAVRREIRALREIDRPASESTAAAMALVLAAELDAREQVTCRECGATIHVDGTTGTQKAQIARALAQVMEQMRGRGPARTGKSKVDEVTAKRNQRRTRRAET